jgi:hypothetical protein
MTPIQKNHEGIKQKNSMQNDLGINDETYSFDDFFEDDYLDLEDYLYFDEYQDEREYTDHFIPIAHHLSSDDEIPRKTLGDVFPDILH